MGAPSKKLEFAYGAKPLIGLPLLAIAGALGYAAYAAEPLFGQIVIAGVALIVLMTALGALMSTRVTIDPGGSIWIRHRLPLYTLALVEVPRASITAVEFDANWVSMRVGKADNTESRNLRVEARLRAGDKTYFLFNGSVPCDGPPGNAGEVRAALGRGRKIDIYDDVSAIARTLGVPVIATNSGWGRDAGKNLSA